MKIKLLNNYLIEIEPLNYILKQSYTAKNGKEAEKVHGYFPNLADAVEWFLKLNQLDEAMALVVKDGENEEKIPVLPFADYVYFVEKINKAAMDAITGIMKEAIECMQCSGARLCEGVKADD